MIDEHVLDELDSSTQGMNPNDIDSAVDSEQHDR